MKLTTEQHRNLRKGYNELIRLTTHEYTYEEFIDILASFDTTDKTGVATNMQDVQPKDINELNSNGYSD